MVNEASPSASIAFEISPCTVIVTSGASRSSGLAAFCVAFGPSGFWLGFAVGSTPSAGSAMRNAATVAPSTTKAARRSIFTRLLSARARPIQGFGPRHPGARAHRARATQGQQHERLLKPLLAVCHLSASSKALLVTGLTFAKPEQSGVCSARRRSPRAPRTVQAAHRQTSVQAAGQRSAKHPAKAGMQYHETG